MQIKDALAVESQFCALLTKLQRDSGMTQRDFAKQLGFSYEAVSNIIRTQKLGNFGTFKKMLAAVMKTYDLPATKPWPIVDKDLYIVTADNTAGIDPDFCPKCKKVNYHCHCHWQKIK
jgi:transcriptional regulator with XRE-family HTH domain